MLCCDWPDSAVWPSYEIWKFPFQLTKFEVFQFPFYSLASEEKKPPFPFCTVSIDPCVDYGLGGTQESKWWVKNKKKQKTQKPPGLSAKDKKSLVKTFIPVKI